MQLVFSTFSLLMNSLPSVQRATIVGVPFLYGTKLFVWSLRYAKGKISENIVNQCMCVAMRVH